MAVDDFEKEAKGKKCASEELCSFVAALLHSDLAAVHLPTLDSTGETPPSNAKTKFQTLLEAIGAESPKLRLLHVRTLETKTPPLLTQGSSLGETFFSVLPQLASLRVILLDLFRCDDWTLQQFAMHATNIVYGPFLILSVNLFLICEIFSVLQVELSLEISIVGFEALSTLRHLRQFLFGNCFEGRSLEHDKKCLLWCAQFLPQLKVAGRHFDFLYGYTRGSEHHNELVQQQQLPKLSLADLTIGRDVEPHENLQLPELESLSLWLPMKDVVSLCDHFATISALALHGTWVALPDLAIQILTVLQNVGGRLRSLSLQEVDVPLSLAKIFESCPRLESFRIQFCNFNDAPTVQWPEKYFSYVKEAHVGNPPGFVMQVNGRKKIQDVFPFGVLYQLKLNIFATKSAVKHVFSEILTMYILYAVAERPILEKDEVVRLFLDQERN
jgi:hypothetical protein